MDAPAAPPSIGRITALGLLIAAVTIFVLALLIVLEVQRETELNRELIGAQQVKDGLQSLNNQLHELKFAAREYGFTGGGGALQAIEQNVVEAEADLLYLTSRAAFDETLAPYVERLKAAVEAFTQFLRNTSRTRASSSSGDWASERAESLEAAARAALDRALDAQTQRINERVTAQIRVGESLNVYVMLLIAGAVVLLAGLFAAFVHAQSRNREAQRRIEYLAHYDSLTRLPNRALLADRLAQEAVRSRRGARAFAVVLFDLDGFKTVNDTHGHAIGDMLLAQVASRSRESVRTSDTVGRLGGDEFLAILPETAREGALQVAEKLRTSLEKPYDISGRTVHLTASVGISLYPGHGADGDALYRAADAALYAAKRGGRNRTAVARGAEETASA